MLRLIRTFWVVAIMVIGAAISPTAASGAQTDIVDAVCLLGSDEITFDPGIVLLEPRLTTMNAHVRTGECTTSVPGITSATARNTNTLVRTCNDLLGGGAGSIVLTWNDPKLTSTVTYTSTVVRGTVATVVTHTGTVTSGLFVGDAVTVVETIPNIQFLDCATPTGMARTSGITQTTITRQ